MDEIIEAILSEATTKANRLSLTEQSFVYTELSEHFTRLSHDAIMAEFGMKEEDEP